MTKTKLPKRLLTISICFMLVPPASIVFNLVTLNLPFSAITKMYGPFELALLAFAPIVGLAILKIHRYSWYLFIAYTLAVLGQNLYLFKITHYRYTIPLLASSLILLGLVAWFFHKDISAPYFAGSVRGFRRRRRRSVQKEVTINGTRLNTVNISRRGVLVEWKNCPLNTGDTVQMKVLSHGRLFNGEVVRIEDDHVGIALIKKTVI